MSDMELTERHVPTLDEIKRLQSEISEMPQPELETEHYFSGGMYCRKLIAPAGLLVVGKIHKKDHFFMCAKGQIIAWSENGMVTMNAGDVLCSKAGTKRVILAVNDSIYINFHKTNKTNLDKIEKELIEPDELALYDSSNKLKVQALEDK
jgi:hypothetical protein